MFHSTVAPCHMCLRSSSVETKDLSLLHLISIISLIWLVDSAWPMKMLCLRVICQFIQYYDLLFGSDKLLLFDFVIIGWMK